MRRAGGVGLLEDGGDVIGFLLKADYCAEHEHGMRGLASLFRIGEDREAVGLAGRTAGHVPEGRAVLLGEFPALPPDSHRKAKPVGRGLALVVDRFLAYRAPEEDDAFLGQLAGSHGWRLTDDEAVAAWGERSFAIFAYSERAKAAVTRLHGAIMSGDFAAWLGGGATGNPFGRDGLVVAVASMVPEAGARVMLEADVESRRLRAAVEATGIEERLREAGKGYYALSPRFREDGDGLETGHPVVFWLNPRDQRESNFGWFTVEDLDGWIEGRGPVVSEPPAPSPSPR